MMNPFNRMTPEHGRLLAQAVRVAHTWSDVFAACRMAHAITGTRLSGYLDGCYFNPKGLPHFSAEDDIDLESVREDAIEYLTT